MVDNSNLDWGFRTQPQPRMCLAQQQGQCRWYRGKVMGGSSVLNYMFYIRANKKDYDNWEAMGNPGWSSKDVLYYFKKSEDNRNPEFSQNTHYHSTGGPLTVEHFPYQDKNVPLILNGLLQSGYKYVDSNAEEQIGAMRLQMTTRDGLRLSTNGAFIRPIRKQRKNLFIRKQAYVTRLLIDPKTKNTFGVEYVQNGQVKYAIAHKEVIVSAGAIQSPQILKVSGIGPKRELKSLGIPVLVDLPVGKNLQDHATLHGLIFGLTNSTATLVSQEQMVNDVYRYFHHHDGPLSATGPFQVNAFYRTPYADDYDVPDIQFAFGGTNIQDFYMEPTMPNIAAIAYYNGIDLQPILLNPKSRGEILLNRTDPVFGAPLIYPNFFSEYPDLDTLVEGIIEAIRVFETSNLKQYAELIRIPLPGCRHFEFGTREYWECVVMAYTATIYHPCCTNKMGPREDYTSVVDHELKVHGIKRLRVIDASIMPVIVAGNTNAPTIMIAEKGSDMIKELWLETK